MRDTLEGLTSSSGGMTKLPSSGVGFGFELKLSTSFEAFHFRVFGYRNMKGLNSLDLIRPCWKILSQNLSELK